VQRAAVPPEEDEEEADTEQEEAQREGQHPQDGMTSIEPSSVRSDSS